jgi:protocatechuate 3,4-dioxygenase alpha subunit
MSVVSAGTPGQIRINGSVYDGEGVVIPDNLIETVPGPDGSVQAPHIDVSGFTRGLLHRCVTRLYFADEAQANATDPVPALVPEARRGTLLAQPTQDGYQFDIRLQGADETVFFAV